MLIDSTYEADLMAAAGLDYHVGREAQSAWLERLSYRSFVKMSWIA